MVHGKRQRRNDRNHLGAGIRLSLRPGDDHQHHSVGVVRDAVITWQLKYGTSLPLEDWWSLPVVAETWDGYLNDINGFHVTAATRTPRCRTRTAERSPRATSAAARE